LNKYIWESGCIISKEDLEKWAKENFPQYAHNTELMKYAWMNAQGMPVALPTEPIKIVDLVPNIRATLKVLIAAQVSVRKYKGCPIHLSKLNEDGICPKCGNEAGVEMVWREYIAGDDTGTISLSVAPSVKIELPEKKEVTVIGYLNPDTKIFNVLGIA